MHIRVERGHHRFACDAIAPFRLDELLDPSERLALGLVGVVVPPTRQVVEVFRPGAEAGRLQEVTCVLRQVLMQVVEPRVVLGRRVGRSPHPPVGRPAVLHGREAPETRRQRIDDLHGYLDKFVEDGERHFQRQHPGHVVRGIQRSEQHLALDVIEAQRELALGGPPRAGLPVLEPVVPRHDRGVPELRRRVPYHDCPGAPNAVRPGFLQLGHAHQLEEESGGLAGADRPDDPVVEQLCRPVVDDVILDRRGRRVVDYVRCHQSGPVV